MCTARDRAINGPRPFATGQGPFGVLDVAARLEHRLYDSDQSRQAVHEACAFAVRHGMSSVIARPQAVPSAATQLAGTSVGLVTVLGWRSGGVETLSTRPLLAEAGSLAAHGATDLGMLVDAHRLATDRGQRLADDVSALVAAMRPRDVRVRVILDTDGLTREATAAACELLADTGVWLVQGGSWRGARTGLSRIQLMRAALPEGVRLKWTFPVRSLDSMMVCIAEGVDLFNGDAPALLKDAARRVAMGPLTLPVKGVNC